MKGVELMNFDPNKAVLKNKSFFKPFNVKDFMNVKELLKSNKINKEEEILIFEVNKKYYGLKTVQMFYHHIAQGVIDNEPFMVSF